MKEILLVGLAIWFMLSGWTAGASATIISNFDDSLEGWTTNDSGPLTHQSSGGNPGGYLLLDNSELSIAQIFAPTSFHGDLSSYIGGTLSFDGNMIGDGGSYFDGPNHSSGPYLDYGIIQITGSSISAQVDLLPNGATAPFQSWQTYSVALDAAAWEVSDEYFLTLMQNVTSLAITIEGLWGTEMQGIDNVRLQGPVAPVPEPATMLLMGTGLLGLAGVRRKKK